MSDEATSTDPATAAAEASATPAPPETAAGGQGAAEATPEPSGPKAPFVDVPQLGRIVHFVTGFDEERAAIVTAVHPDGRAQLCSFRPTGVPEPITEPVEYDPEGGRFTWHWYGDCER